MRKYIIGLLLVAVFPLIVILGRVEGNIEVKYAKTTYGDSVYFFILDGKRLEVSRRNYYLYHEGDYFKQGVME